MARKTTSRVLKVMSIFAGVESVGIICSMIKNKLVAIWLSAVGTGLFSIFNTTIETATFLTGFGLRQSTVRDLAVNARDDSRLHRIIRSVRSWSILTGMLGALLLTALAWPLAQLILGDGALWWNFAILGCVMLLNALYAGENAIFQGTENFRRLARTGFETSIVGLLVSIPMYRCMGDESVICSIAAYGVVGLAAALINRNRSFDCDKPDTDSLKEGREFVKFGAYLSVAGFVSTVCQLIFISWLNLNVSTAEAGFYAAGMAIVIRYTSLIFNSVGMEFYPRLSANTGSLRRVNVFVNHEVSLLLHIFTPLVLLFLIFMPLVVRILYSSEFAVIVTFASIGILTVLFRSVSTVMGYSIVARGEGRIYLVVESLDAVIGLSLSLWCYITMGLDGIGVALLLWHFIYMLMVGFVCRAKFKIRLFGRVFIMFLISLAVSALSLASVMMLDGITAYILPAVGAVCYTILFLQICRHRRKGI